MQLGSTTVRGALAGRSDDAGGELDVDDLTKQHREHLVAAGQKSIESFDRTLLTLSGGGLALSIAFVKDLGLQGRASTAILIAAWIFWLLAMALTLVSFYVSYFAIYRAIQELDDDSPAATSACARWTWWVHACNIAAGLMFLLGLGFVIWFAGASL